MFQTPDFKTLLAPNNDATGNPLSNDAAALAELVSRHIVIGRQTEADLRTTDESARSPAERFRSRPDDSLFGGARIVAPYSVRQRAHSRHRWNREIDIFSFGPARR